jgi:penicillin G amidase
MSTAQEPNPRRIPGLAGAVDVWRDAWCIPHIKAGTAGDAFSALGFVHAEDRLWQMEALRRRGTGRFAEWAGAAALGGDILARQLGTEAASRRDLDLIGPEARAMLERYAEGVNAFIALKRWPVEYALLETAPEAWQPWHSIAVMRQIGFLLGSIWPKLWRAAALPILGADALDLLRMDDGGIDLLCQPPMAEAERLLPDLAALGPAIQALLSHAPPDATQGGSNNWALAGQHVASGLPLLAGDPHRTLELPGMYVQTQLACDEFDTIGFSIPGVPGFPHFGHNHQVAWCVTHAFMDIHDLFIERFDADANHYLSGDTWLPTAKRVERVAVRGAAPVEVTVIETRHGPVIAGNPAAGTALVLRSMQFAEPDRSFDCLLPMLRATGVEALFAATKGWGLIDHNLVAADTAGRIGQLVRAIVPRRKRANGWLPVPGWTGAHDWQGMIPWEEMPRVIDPPGGRIVTANNRVIADGEPYLSTDCHPPHRARRIWARLAALGPATPDVMATIHRDLLSLPALALIERLKQVAVADPAAAALRDQIAAWDGEMRVDSAAASSYALWRIALAEEVECRAGLNEARGNPYGAVAPGIHPVTQLWWSIPAALRRDDRRLTGGAAWDEVIVAALAVAARQKRGDWGALHRPRLSHFLSALFLERAGELDIVSAAIGGDAETVCASTYHAGLGPTARSASVARYVFAVGDWQNSRWIVFHGASGDPASPNYRNQNQAWAKGELIPMLSDWTELAAAGATPERLLPA